MAFRASSTRRSTASSAVSATATVFNNSSGGGFTISGSTVTANTAVSIGVVTSGQSSASGTTSIPIITGYTVTDGSYNNFDDTAVNTSGGYIKVNGSGFASGTIVYINGSVVSSTYVSSTQMRAVVPALAAGSYSLMVFTGTAGAIYSSLVTSGFPSWTSSSYTSTTLSISVQLLATGDGTLTYSLYSGTLPSGLTLASNGLISGTATGDSVTSDLVFLVNDGQLQTTQQTVSLTISTADTYWKNTTAILQGDVVPFISDASTNAFTVTPVGDTRPYNFNPYTSGYYSYYLAGAGSASKINVSGSGIFGASTSYTVEGWFYFTTASSGDNLNIIATNTNTYPDRWILDVAVGSTTLQLRVVTESNAILRNGTSVTTTSLNTWVHLAFVNNVAGNSFTFYINGTAAGSGTAVSLASYATLNLFCNSTSASAAPFYVSNFRIVSGTAVYTDAFTPSTTPLTAITNTKLLTAQSNRFIDNSSSALVLTASGTPSVKPNHPFTPNSSYAAYGSAYFDGTGDYLTVADNAALEIGSSDFTIEAWIYPISNASSTYYTWIFKGPDNSFGTFYFPQYNGVIKMFFDDNGSSPWLYHGINSSYNAGTLTINAWNHLAITRSGTSIRGFVNGVLGSTITVSAGQSFFNSSSGLSLGAQTAGSEPSNGYMADFRFIIGSAVYTSAFTPPTTPLTAISGTSLLTLQTNLPHNNNTILDNSTNNFAVTRTGSPIQGTFSPYSGYYSNYFDGTGDYLSLTKTGGLGSGNFTLEFWFNPSVSNGTTLVFNSRTSGTGSDGIDIFSDLKATTASVVLMSASSLITLNAWTHVAFVRSGSTLTRWVNGVSDATSTISNDFSGTSFLIGGSNVGNVGYLTGYISNLRNTNTAVYTGAFTPPTTLLATSQSSGTNIAALTTIGSVNNKSVSFNGSTDYLSVADTTALQLGTGDFTVEGWIYFSALPTSGGYMVLAGKYHSTSESIIVLLRNTSGAYTFEFVSNISTVIGSYSPIINTWYHVAAVRASGTGKLYVNGTLIATAAFSDSVSNSGYNWKIGVIQSTGSGSILGYLNGYISNLRIVKGTAVYTAAFTPSTTPLTAITNTVLLTCQSPTIIDNSTNAFSITTAGSPTVNYTTSPFSIDAVKLLTCQSNRLIDNSTNAFTITKNGDTSVKPFSPFSRSAEYSIASNGGSVYFNGSTDYLSVADNAAFAFGTGDFTIEAWIYPTATAVFPIVSKGVSASTGFAFALGTTNKLNFLITTGTSASPTIASTATVLLNVWTHVAVVRSGTTVTMYINGVADGTGTYATNLTTASILYVGIARDVTTYGTGYLSNVRVIKGTALYTTTFTPPTTPLLPIQNTGLLIDGTSGAVIGGTQQHNITTVADTRVLNTQYKYGSGSYYFDGTGDYMLTTPSTELEFGAGDFTIEMWWYPTSTARQALYCGSFGTDYSVGIDYSSTVGNQKIGVWASSTGSSWNLVNADGGGNGVGTVAVNQNAWNHIAFVRYGTTWMSFVNGTRDRNITGLSGTIIDRSTAKKAIGCWFSTGAMAQVTGYLDDIRITKGYARYVANFTVPAVAFKAR